VGSELISIWSIDHHLDGRGEKIMDSGAFENSTLEGFLNSRELRNRHPMGQLDVLKSQLDDLFNHLFTVRVAAVVPTRRESEHEKVRRDSTGA